MLNLGDVGTRRTVPIDGVQMAKCNENEIATIIARETGVSLQGRKDLGVWGKTDESSKLSPDRFLFFEIEAGQKHPNTNVLKLWPYLEENPGASVILAQVFVEGSACCDSSRGKLASWLGAKLESIFPDRFRYCRLLFSRERHCLIDGLDSLKDLLIGRKTRRRQLP